MSKKMRVMAIKMTEDTPSIKIIYEKNGRYFMRTGEDEFKVGKSIQDVGSLYKYGFRKVTNPTEFRDAEDIQQNINRFELKPDGSVTYSG